MPARYEPTVSSFIAFSELDPSTENRCIYLTLKGARCRWDCEANDHKLAIELHETLKTLPAATISVDLVEDYILCNCCRRAGHREKIEDARLWTPLAERWLDEIRRDTARELLIDPAVSLEQEPTIPDNIAPCHSSVIHTTTSASSPATHPSSINTTPPVSSIISSGYESDPPKSPLAEAGNALRSSADHSTYNLRPREITTRPAVRLRLPLSEFRAHIAEPGPDDSVASKLLGALQDRDFEEGSLYIFDRDSSPDHVKIGWTARSVQDRLDAWSLCGYTPNLLFSVHGVPHAQRAETLTHYELMKQWRRERQCKASHCRKSHKEWFQVSKERAMEVAGNWARFMRIAMPYEPSGALKAKWVDFAKKAKGKGELLTATMLLDYHEHPVTEVTAPVKESTNLGHIVKIEKLEGDLQIMHVPERKSANSEEPLQLKGEVSPGLGRLSTPSHKPKEESKSIPLFEFGPLPRLEYPIRSESLNKGASHPAIESAFEGKLFSQARYSSADSPSEWKTKDFSFAFPSSLPSLSMGNPFDMNLLPKTPDSIRTSLSSGTVSSSPDATLVDSDSLLNTAQQFKFGPPFDAKPVQNSRFPPSTSFTFASELPFKVEPSWKSPVLSASRGTSGTDSLFNFKETTAKALSEKVSEDKKLPVGQILLPPPPIPRNADSRHSPISRILAPDSCTKSEEASVTEEAIKSESETLRSSQRDEARSESRVEIDHDKGGIESRLENEEGEGEDEETLVETIGRETLEKAALQIASELSKEIGFENVKGSHNALDKITVSVSEVLPAVQIAV